MSKSFVFEIRRFLYCIVDDRIASFDDSVKVADPDNFLFPLSKIHGLLRCTPELGLSMLDVDPDAFLVRLSGPQQNESEILEHTRAIFSCDNDQKRAHSTMEFHVLDSELGERRVYPITGRPHRFPLSNEIPTPATPTKMRETERAPSLFEITSFLDEPKEPEVRLEFNDWDHLEETLSLEEPPETDGSQLGDAMEAEILSQKLLQNTEGTHPGGYFDNHEGDNVLFHFNTLEDAHRVAAHFQPIFTNKRKLRAFFKKHGLNQDD